MICLLLDPRPSTISVKPPPRPPQGELIFPGGLVHRTSLDLLASTPMTMHPMLCDSAGPKVGSSISGPEALSRSAEYGDDHVYREVVFMRLGQAACGALGTAVRCADPCTLCHIGSGPCGGGAAAGCFITLRSGFLSWLEARPSRKVV